MPINLDFARNPQLKQGLAAIFGQAAFDNVGTVYYVDCNAGADTNDGLSWATAFKKLSIALAASHANIAATSAGWANRNTIYFKGDQTATADGENLVKLAQKTDVIGVGSTDWKSKPQLIGNVVIPTTISYQGCRFFNCMFKGPILVGGDIITMTSQHGIELVDCEFMGDSTTPATGAILSFACVGLKIRNCVFKGAFSDSVIEIGAGQADDLVIENCVVQGADKGIEVLAAATFAAGKYGLIKDNVVSSTLVCIEDATNKCYVVGNKGITLANKGAALAGAVVCNIALALDNRFGTGDANNIVYPANGAIG